MGNYYKSNEHTHYTGSSGLNGNRRATMYGKTGYENSSKNFIPDPEPPQNTGPSEVHQFVSKIARGVANNTRNTFSKRIFPFGRKARSQTSLTDRLTWGVVKVYLIIVLLCVVGVAVCSLINVSNEMLFGIPHLVKYSFYSLKQHFNFSSLLILLGSAIAIAIFALALIWEIISGMGCAALFLIITTLIVGLPLTASADYTLKMGLFTAFKYSILPACLLFLIRKVRNKLTGD